MENNINDLITQYRSRVCVCVCVCVHSVTQSCSTLCTPMETAACQAPLSTEFSISWK